MEIVRKKLDPAEVSSPLVRYDTDCACIQTTSDGTTWVNTPARDMRSSPSFALPPVAGGNPPCDAAASVIENFRTGLSGLIVQIDEGVSIFGAASWIITLLDFLDGIGVFIQLFVDLVTLIIGIGTTGVSAAFTDAVYQELECILSCAFASDGTMTPDKFTEAQTQITTAFGALSDVNLVFQGWLAPLGNVGLQNIAALKHVTGDCSECASCINWCDAYNFLTNDWSWVCDTDAIGSLCDSVEWTSAEGWNMDTYPGGGNKVAVIISPSLPPMEIKHVELDATTDNGWSSTNSAQIGVIRGAVQAYNESAGLTTGAPHTYAYDVTWEIEEGDIFFIVVGVGDSAAGAHNFSINAMRFQGTGDDPMLGEPC